MTLVYVAQAVDRDAPQIPAKFEEVLDWLRHDFVLYRPASAFTVPPGGVGTDSCVRDVNMAALDRADALLVLLPVEEPRSWGVPAEVERAIVAAKPVTFLVIRGSRVVGGWSTQYAATEVEVIAAESASLPRVVESVRASLTRRTALVPHRPVADLPVRMDSGAARLPTRGHSDDAGLDLYVSALTTVPPGQFVDVPCGVAVELPAGTWGLLTGRSSTMRRRGLQTIQGVIDCGYRGELFAGVFNPGSEEVVLEEGERVSQLIVLPNLTAGLRPVPARELSDSDRGAGGFGSTGL